MIQWLEEDDCFLVGFPDFPGQQWRTHGDTYEEAMAHGISLPPSCDRLPGGIRP